MKYNVEQKRHWRYWVWKRIAENCKVHPRFATVLFLAGPSPLDLEAARKNGFRIENIVAVDIDKQAVEEARKAGCTAIQGTLHEVATKWSDGVIHGIVADYCCGLTSRCAIQSFQLLRLANVAVFNFQRGRETDSESRLVRDVCCNPNRALQFDFWCDMIWKLGNMAANKSKDAYESFWKSFVDPITEVSLPHDSQYRQALEKLRAASVAYAIYDLLSDTEEPIQQWKTVTDSMSYRSNKVVMDTALCVCANIRLPNIGANGQWKTPIDSRLAACKAIRTINGAVRHASKMN